MADLELVPDREHEDLAGWVLGALDPEEHARFRAHLETCRECQDGVAEFGPTARLLNAAAESWQADDPAATTAVPPPDQRATVRVKLPAARPPADAEPPADLKERTLARVREAAAGERTEQTERTAAKTGWMHRTSYRWAAAAAAVVVVAGGGAAAAVVSEAAPAAAFTIPMHAQNGSSAAGQARAHQTGSGWSISMTVSHLKRLPAGQFYECWYASRDSTPGDLKLITAGTFTVGASGSATVQMWSAADPKQFPTMQITEETAGDASQHGTVILSGTARA